MLTEQSICFMCIYQRTSPSLRTLLMCYRFVLSGTNNLIWTNKYPTATEHSILIPRNLAGGFCGFHAQTNRICFLKMIGLVKTITISIYHWNWRWNWIATCIQCNSVSICPDVFRNLAHNNPIFYWFMTLIQSICWSFIRFHLNNSSGKLFVAEVNAISIDFQMYKASPTMI